MVSEWVDGTIMPGSGVAVDPGFGSVDFAHPHHLPGLVPGRALARLLGAETWGVPGGPFCPLHSPADAEIWWR